MLAATGSGGEFLTLLIKLLVIARDDDAFKLVSSFPGEMAVIGRIRNDADYFDNLRLRWENLYGHCMIVSECNPRIQEMQP